jgi:hypothetical protein
LRAKASKFIRAKRVLAPLGAYIGDRTPSKRKCDKLKAGLPAFNIRKVDKLKHVCYINFHIQAG